MKKLLLFAACCLSLNAWADVTVITMANGADAFGEHVATWNTQGFNLTANSEGGNNAPVVNANSGDMRNYANGSFTIETNVPITDISFAISDKGLQRFATITVDNGTIAEQGANPLVWNGNAKSVKFIVGDRSDYGTEEGKAGQFDFTTITITTDGTPSIEGGTTPDNPDTPGEPDGDYIYKGLVDNADDWELFTYWTSLELAEDESDPDIWKWDSKYGLKASGHINNVNIETEAFAFSPWIDLTEYTDCVLTFDHALNFLDLSKYDREWYVQLVGYDLEYYDAEDDEDVGVYKFLDVPNWPEGTNWTFVNSGNVDLSDFDGKWVDFYFYYYAGPTEEQTADYEEGRITEADLVNVAATWEIKNFIVTGVGTSGVREVIFDSNAPVEYYNLNGMRVANPANGIYVCRQGNKVSKVIVK